MLHIHLSFEALWCPTLLSHCKCRGGGDSIGNAATMVPCVHYRTPLKEVIEAIVVLSVAALACAKGPNTDIIRVQIRRNSHDDWVLISLLHFCTSVPLQVTAATTQTMLLLTSSASSIVYAQMGDTPWDWATVMLPMAFFATLAGQVGLALNRGCQSGSSGHRTR